jgi:RNA polymerase sigma-70 factor (ECF subfamily)
MTAGRYDRHDEFLRRFTAHQTAIYGFVRSMVSRREDAREVMQEVAVVLWAKFDEFDESKKFRRWACGVAKFEVLSFLRDRARDRLRFDESLLSVLAEEAIADDSGDSRRGALDGCLEKLAPESRQLVLNAYSPGVSIHSLAIARGQSAMSLYKVLHRIRLMLLECIERSAVAKGTT